MLLLAPEALLALGALAMPGIYLTTRSRRAVAHATVSLLGLALLVLVLTWWFPGRFGLPDHGGNTSLLDHLEITIFSQLFKAAFLLAALGTGAAATGFLRDEEHQAEFYALLLTATLGMLVVASATDLLTLLLGLELAAFSSYALVAFRKHNDLSTEAGVKYFIIGAFSSALTLYGMSLLFAITGQLEFHAVADGLDRPGFSAVTFVALLCIIAGLGFKVASVPFHAWAPDVYQGAAAPVAAFLASASKTMGFVALFRLFFVAFAPEVVRDEWQLIIGILALASMTLGNLVALSQENTSRMLAYSSIAQTGYLLLALPVATETALAGAIAHTLMHTLMEGGAFLVVAGLGFAGLGWQRDAFKGLGRRAPLLALAMAVFMFGLAGVPLLGGGGFLSKFWLFAGVVEAGLDGHGWLLALVVAGVLNTALSLFYYLRIIRYMYLYDPEGEGELDIPAGIRISVLVALVLLLVAAQVWWGPFYELCQEAANSLL